VIGVLLLGLSFAINTGPPPNPTSAELMKFGLDNYAHFFEEHGCRRLHRF
jgi:hypothetical protein